MDNYRVRITDYVEGNYNGSHGSRCDGPIYHDFNAALQHAFDLVVQAVYNSSCSDLRVSSNNVIVRNGKTCGFSVTMAGGYPDEPEVVNIFDIVNVDYDFVI